MSAASSGRAPRVLIDGYFIDRAYGFGRYVRELVHALDREPVLDVVIAVTPRGESVARRLVTRARVVTARERFFPIWEQVTLPLLARRLGVDLVHFPYQSSALRWPAAQSIVTVHDLMFLRPQVTSSGLVDRLAHTYRRWTFRLHWRRSAGVVAVSDATGDELHDRLDLAATVIPNICDAFVSMHESPDRKQPGPPRYFLHRGAMTPHKNTRRIAIAFGELRRDHPDLELRVFGVAPDAALAQEIGAPGIRFLGRVDDAELAALYRGATAVVTASLEEGFGLAIIEAFSFGTPVITSNRPPMSEIAGDAALLVDPERVESIGAAMRRLVEEAGLADRLVAAGHRRRAPYTGAAVADRFAAVYRQVATG